MVLVESTTKPSPSELRAIWSLCSPATGAAREGRRTLSLTVVPAFPKSTVATTELRASSPSILRMMSPTWRSESEAMPAIAFTTGGSSEVTDARRILAEDRREDA